MTDADWDPVSVLRDASARMLRVLGARCAELCAEHVYFAVRSVQRRDVIGVGRHTYHAVRTAYGAVRVGYHLARLEALDPS